MAQTARTFTRSRCRTNARSRLVARVPHITELKPISAKVGEGQVQGELWIGSLPHLFDVLPSFSVDDLVVDDTIDDTHSNDDAVRANR